MYDLATKQMRQLTHLPYGLSASDAAMDNAWTLYYTVVPGSQQTNPATGIHMLNLNTGADKVLLPDLAGIDYSVSVARTGVVAPTPVVVGESCPSVELVGVRGSRENAADTNLTDSTILATLHTIGSRVKDFHQTAIDYPAVPVNIADTNYPPDYVTSIDTGEQALTEFVGDFSAGCSNAKIVVVGYSQGAHVVGDVVEQLTAPNRKTIAAVVLLGDPKFNPKQTLVDRGDFEPGRSGIFQLVVPKSELRQVPSDFVDGVHSYCAAGDPVCNWNALSGLQCKSAGNACAHQQYEQLGWTTAAGAWVIERLSSAAASPSGP